MYEFKGKKVTVMSCSNCNIKCKHCYVSYKGNFSGEQLYDICNKLKDKYQLNINGTEVLLHRDYFQSFCLIGQKRILSNGVIINQDDTILVEIKNSTIEMVAMSYHFGIHQEISPVEQEILISNIKKLQANNIKVELMCTVTQANYDKILNVCESVVALNVHKVRFINYLKTGNALYMEDNNILTSGQKIEFFRQLNLAREKYAEEELLIKRCGSFGMDHNHYCNFSCSAGYEEVVIAPDLKVYPCIYLVKPGLDIGKYEDGKVIIDKEITHDRQHCLANNIFNKDEKFRI